MNVAVLRLQQSPKFGHFADSQTVWSPSPRTTSRTAVVAPALGSGFLNQSGRVRARALGGWSVLATAGHYGRRIERGCGGRSFA
jgi:hypothetical protein